MINSAKIQVIFKIPVDFDIGNIKPYVAEIIARVIDRGAKGWLALGTYPVDGFYLSNRAIHTSYDDLMDVLARYPELPFEILAAQSFANDSERQTGEVDDMEYSVLEYVPTIYKSASAAVIEPYLNDVIEYDDDGIESSRSRPVDIKLNPPVAGGTMWVFDEAA